MQNHPVHSASTESEAKCSHNKYWTTQFGDCMACRAEKAEEQRYELIQALSDLIEVSEIAVSWGMITDRPDMNGPLPRARALLAKLASKE